MSTVGENIRRFRKSKKLTQTELGNLTGVSASAIMRYEKGDRNISMSALKTMASVLGVGINELVWEGSGPAPEPLHAAATPQGGIIIGDRQEKLLYEFSKLNDRGQEKAIENVQIIAGNPEFQK